MAMTDRKRRFAAALRSGATNKAAAIEAGYSEKTASAAGSRLAKDADVLAEIGRKDHVEQAKEKAKAQGKEINLPDLGKMYSDPKDFLKALMNDPGEDMKLRADAAKSLMPFVHQRKGQGIKPAAQAAAEKASAGKFAPSAPPRLVAVGGSRS